MMKAQSQTILNILKNNNNLLKIQGKSTRQSIG